MALETLKEEKQRGIGFEEEEPMDTSNEACTFSEKYNREQLPDLLVVYYQRIFPFQKYYDWLFYGRRAEGTPFELIGCILCN